MAGKVSVATHITRGDVLDDLGFTRSEATALKIKADLLDAPSAPKSSARSTRSAN